ncbi:MAG: FAD binding domain-containing protein, partial [Oscillospiraceae bacterium]|nr:FAD binding domain-containing protein [Oscillospiraceae bacterium]
MKSFNHINAETLEEAAAELKKDGAVAIAGGGDLIGALKDDIFPEYPKTVVNLKTIPGLDGISLGGGTLKIGALAALADIARSPVVIESARAVADAAGKASSPSLRETTTIGGNVCQMPHCWYFRKLGNRFNCARKGGERCFAVSGDNRYHSVFGAGVFETADGAKRACIAANQSDMSSVLTALGAVFKTTERLIDAADFFSAGVLSSTVLNRGEILTEIRIPVSERSKNCRYKRFAFRKSIDFPVLSVALAVDGAKNCSIVLGGAAPAPYAAIKAEALIRGKEITPALASEAGEAAADGAKPTDANAYKVQLIRTLVKREL